MRGRKFVFSTVMRQGSLALTVSSPFSSSRTAVTVPSSASMFSMESTQLMRLAPKRSASCGAIWPVAPSRDSLPQKMSSKLSSLWAAVAMT